MRKVIFAPDNYYHIYNRGVDKRKIFIDKSNYYRFIHDLYEFNDEDAAPGSQYRGSTSLLKYRKRKKREILVDIVCYCLMPNHYHLILKQLKEDGIVKIMQKLGTGYAMYFNKRNERTGSLFESRFKAVLIDSEEYLIHLSRYIHLNPTKLMDKQKLNLKSKTVNEFLEKYRWSSYPDYIGKRNFPSVINKDIIAAYFDTPGEYKKFVNEYTEKDTGCIEDLMLED